MLFADKNGNKKALSPLTFFLIILSLEIAGLMFPFTAMKSETVYRCSQQTKKHQTVS